MTSGFLFLVFFFQSYLIVYEVSITGTCGQDPILLPFFFLFFFNIDFFSYKQHFATFYLSHVEDYLLHSTHRTKDREKIQCYRQFIRGFNFHKENYIHNIMVNLIDDMSKFCYVRSKCYPSMKQEPYTQWLLITKDKPFHIAQASCTCPAG
jgi:hypothetical protein